MIVEGPNWINCSAQDMRWLRERKWRQAASVRSFHGDRLIPSRSIPSYRREAELVGQTTAPLINPLERFRPARMKAVSNLRTALPSAQERNVPEREMKRIEPETYSSWAETSFDDDYDDDYEFGYEIAA